MFGVLWLFLNQKRDTLRSMKFNHDYVLSGLREILIKCGSSKNVYKIWDLVGLGAMRIFEKKKLK